jgi:hypothetical protein
MSNSESVSGANSGRTVVTKYDKVVFEARYSTLERARLESALILSVVAEIIGPLLLTATTVEVKKDPTTEEGVLSVTNYISDKRAVEPTAEFFETVRTVSQAAFSEVRKSPVFEQEQNELEEKLAKKRREQREEALSNVVRTLRSQGAEVHVIEL